jgi:hypothetical protein
MPGSPPEHPHLRLLKGNPGKRPVRTLCALVILSMEQYLQDSVGLKSLSV